jgi:methionyl-tRNA formyltransferase
MRVVFIGTVEFSKKTLQKLIELGTNIVAVITQEQSKFNSDFSDLTELCDQHGIPYRFEDDINSDPCCEWILSHEPNIAFCFGWSKLLGKRLLTIPQMGVVGFHPAALPHNRGRHPIIWALALGLKESACSFFFMDEGADSGDILSQKVFSINRNDTARSVYDKVVLTALDQLEEFVPQLEQNKYLRTKQNHALANVWRKRTKKDGVIDWRMANETIYNLIRSLTRPYIGAHFNYEENEIKAWKSEIVTGDYMNFEPGRVLAVKGNNLIVKCGIGAIELYDIKMKNWPKIGDYL